MKKIIFCFLASFFFFACQNEVLEQTDLGEVKFESVQYETSDIVKLSRKVDVDLIVEIWKDGAIYQQGGQHFRFEKGQLPGTLTLPVGNYSVKAFNAAYELKKELTGADKGEPLFYKEITIHVEADKACRLTIAVPMINMGVSLSLPSGFTDNFTQYEFFVSQGGREIKLLDKETAYFNATAFTYSLKVTNNDGEQKEMSSTFDKNVQSGTIYQVIYSYMSKSLSVN